MSNTIREASVSPAYLALSCVGFIASTLGAGTAFAQTTPATTATEDKGVELQGVTVTDTPITADVKVDRVQSPKGTAPLLDTPQTITVISNRTLQQQNLLTLKDALATIPGITFGAGEGGGGYGDSINLRGFSANSDITIDGVRDSAQYSRSETFNVQQIEVYNGANSVFNGSGSVGGTINIAQKYPTARDATTVNAGIGTEGYYRATVDTNKRINDLIAVRLNAVYHRNDAPGRDVERSKRWGVAPSVTIGIDGPTSLTIGYVHEHDNNTPQYGVPYYAIAGGLPDGVDRHAYYGFRNLDEQKSNLDQGTMIIAHKFSDDVSIRNLTRYQNITQKSVVDPPQGTFCLASTGLTPTGGACTATISATGVTPAVTVTVPPGFYLPTGPRGNLRDTRNQLAYDQLDLRAEFETFGLKHTLVVGGSASWERFDLDTGNVERNANGTNPYGGTSVGAHLPYINIADPSSVIVGPALAGASYGSNLYTGPINYVRSGLTSAEQTDYAGYAFDTIKFGEMVELNGGLRYEKVKGYSHAQTIGITPATLSQVTADTRFDNDATLFSYRVGALFKPTPDTSIYVAYGNSKTPSKVNVNGACTAATCDVDPETAVNYEIGAKADLFEKQLQLTIAAFRNQRDKFKVPSNDPTIPDQVLDGNSRVDGIALGATGNITPAWSIFANYTYLKTKLIRSVSKFCRDNPSTACANSAAVPDPGAGSELLQTPKHSGSLFTTYALPFGLQVGYGLTYQGSFALNTPTLAVPGVFRSKDYLTHRAFASYEIRKGLTAQVNVQNFTNTKYFTSIRNNGWANPGAARSATLSVGYTF